MQTRKRHVFIPKDVLLDYCLKHPDSRQVAQHFGITRRTAQKYLRELRRLGE